MRIYPYTANYYTQNRSQTFNSNMREVKDKKTGETYWTTTYFFRDDFDWLSFAQLLDERYKDADRVNVLNHACSNGAEPMTLVMLFLLKFGAKAEKFFPIVAKDKNANNICMAKNNELIEIDNAEQAILKKWLNNDISMFFYSLGPISIKGADSLRPKPVLTKRINYSQGDLLEDVMKLPEKNNVVLCRNCWLYLNNQEQEEFARRLSQKVDESGLVVIGYFDEEQSAAVKYLNKYGFRETDVEYVYEKSTRPYNKKHRYSEARLCPVSPEESYSKAKNGVIQVQKT